MGDWNTNGRRPMIQNESQILMLDNTTTGGDGENGPSLHTPLLLVPHVSSLIVCTIIVLLEGRINVRRRRGDKPQPRK